VEKPNPLALPVVDPALSGYSPLGPSPTPAPPSPSPEITPDATTSTAGE
jgi:hypothetical protein